MWRQMLLGIILALSVTFSYYFYLLLNYDGRPRMSDNYCWGTKNNCKNNTNIYPFKIDIKKEEIHDLILRIENSRKFTPNLDNTQNQYGLSGHVLEMMIKFIKEEYNFTKRQIYLNRYPQFKTKIQGLDIHFLHIKNNNHKKLPLVPIMLLHGWPSSVREFYESIPMLISEKRQVEMHLVIPSLVGFGYSDGSSKPGFRTAHTAIMMKLLMDRLGYKKFIVHGSDWGGIIATNIATLFPNNIVGFHSNFCFSFRLVTFLKLLLGSFYPPAVVEKKFENKLYPLSRYARFVLAESGYLHLMGSKPDTIGHILDNSPIGILTFMFEKLSIGQNKSNIYSEIAGLNDFNLNEVMDSFLFYYWFPKKGTTSARIYAENLSLRGLFEGLYNIPIDSKVPCACAFFEDDFLYMPVNFLRDKYTNLFQYTTYPGIGHFCAIQVNELLTNDIISFVENLFSIKEL